MTLKKKALENTVGISPFPTVFSALSKRKIDIFATLNLTSVNAFNLVMSKNVIWQRVKLSKENRKSKNIKLGHERSRQKTIVSM